MATFTLTQEQYEALVAFAQQGTYEYERDERHHQPFMRVNQQKALALQAFLTDLEKANGIQRSSLWIQWQDPAQPLPPGTNFPKTWPPEMRFFLQFVSRPICQADVMAVVSQRAPKAVNIMVTPDPAALLGWTAVADYFAP